MIRDLVVLEGTGRQLKPRAARHLDDGAPRFNEPDDDEVIDEQIEPEVDAAEDEEGQARHWYSQAKKYSESGQPHLAIATLQQLVRRFPNTVSAEQARKSLNKASRS